MERLLREDAEFRREIRGMKELIPSSSKEAPVLSGMLSLIEGLDTDTFVRALIEDRTEEPEKALEMFLDVRGYLANEVFSRIEEEIRNEEAARELLPSLSEREEKTLSFIEGYARSEGFPPSVREIAAHLDGCSTSTVHSTLKALKEKGLVRHTEKNRKRSLALTAKEA